MGVVLVSEMEAPSAVEERQMAVGEVQLVGEELKMVAEGVLEEPVEVQQTVFACLEVVQEVSFQLAEGALS